MARLSVPSDRLCLSARPLWTSRSSRLRQAGQRPGGCLGHVRVAFAGIVLLAAGCGQNPMRKEVPAGSASNQAHDLAPAPTATSTIEKSSAVAAAELRYGTVSNDGTYFIAFTPKPDPIPLNHLFELTVRVYAADDLNRPLTDVALQADAAMPDHDHGMNTRPKVRREPDGSFHVAGMQFHMPGHWELYLDASRGNVTERAQFDINLD